jgi:S1-C subfamily serine protease
MRLVKVFGALVALLGVMALALVVAPAVVGRGGRRALAQDRDRDSRRSNQMTVLAGRGSGIGVHITDRAEGGVVVDTVDSESPADKAGIKRSDVIIEFDGEHVRSARQFARLVQETPAGRTVKATITRDGQRRDVQITPDERRGGDVMVMGGGDLLGDYMRDFGRDFGRLGDRFPNFNFNFDFPALSGRRLGVAVEELTGQLADYFGAKDGVLVTAVTDGSPAATAGLKAGDVITTVNGDRIGSREDLVRALRDTTNEDVKIGIVRDKKESAVTAKIEAVRRPLRGRPE